MKITIIGSTQYRNRFWEHEMLLKKAGHQVRIPAFDDKPQLDEVGVCEFNLDAINWADEVHLIWDARSIGTIFDFGMVFALKKAFKIIYLEQKTFMGLMRKYELLNQGGSK